MTPGHRSAHQIHMRDRLADDLPAVDVVDVQRPVLGAMLRQRDRDLLAIRGRNEEVDGGLARRVDDIRIHDDTLGRRVVKVGQRHQERLLPRRLHLQREEGASAGQEPLVRRPLGLQQLLDTGPQRVSPGDPAEVGTAAVLLGLRPGDGLLRGGLLQPSVVLGDIDSVKGVCHRDPRSPHQGELGHVISQQPRRAAHNRTRVVGSFTTTSPHAAHISRGTSRPLMPRSAGRRSCWP